MLALMWRTQLSLMFYVHLSLVCAYGNIYISEKWSKKIRKGRGSLCVMSTLHYKLVITAIVAVVLY